MKLILTLKRQLGASETRLNFQARARRVWVFTRVLALMLLAGVAAGAAELTTIIPAEDTNAVLHNPDMGWVLYENYPLDWRPGGSSTLVPLPGETFPEVDSVALMFSWFDIETEPGHYDFSRVDYACDYWKKRGKAIQLRLSTESLLWWTRLDPPSGKGIPDYVLARVPKDKQQTRTAEGIPYTLVDAREPYYQERLKKFLAAVAAHFSAAREVTLIDLRGFGLWGEWHTGYRYATVADRSAALRQILDLWSQAFPRQYLALSYSYDPDGPKELYAGPTHRYDPVCTTNYQDYLRYSALDHALQLRNVTLRRDGCGGAVHSNERRLCEEAFSTRAKGPMMSEFLGGYAAAKKGKPGWVEWMIEDALSLHPNYICLLGWQGADGRDFVRERPDLVAHGLREMGYRLVPVQVQYPERITNQAPFCITMQWFNRGVGRAMRDYRLRWLLAPKDGRAAVILGETAANTSQWIKGQTYTVRQELKAQNIRPGACQLRLELIDPASGRRIALPLVNAFQGAYEIGPVALSD